MSYTSQTPSSLVSAGHLSADASQQKDFYAIKAASINPQRGVVRSIPSKSFRRTSPIPSSNLTSNNYNENDLYWESAGYSNAPAMKSLTDLQYRQKYRSKTRNQTRNQTRSKTRNQTRSQTRSKVRQKTNISKSKNKPLLNRFGPEIKAFFHDISSSNKAFVPRLCDATQNRGKSLALLLLLIIVFISVVLFSVYHFKTSSSQNLSRLSRLSGGNVTSPIIEYFN